MDFEKLIQHIKTNIANNPFPFALGISVTHIEEGFAQAEMTIRPEHLNPVGVAHGGCIYTLADTVVGSAAASFGTKIVTVSGDYHYLAGAQNGETIIATARCLRAGKTLLPFDVQVCTKDGTLIGKGTFTCQRLKSLPITLD